jgi:hypothetical protein
MAHERTLVAIRYPAPSVPAAFRLYHGGAARRGHLETHSTDSHLYLGDFVYASASRAYARRYADRTHHRSRRRPGLFVLDARYLPDGSRIMHGDRGGWPRRSVERLLFAVIDVVDDLVGWSRQIARCGRTLLDTVEANDGYPTFLRRLAEISALRRSRASMPARDVEPAHVRRALRTYTARYIGRRSGPAAGMAAGRVSDESNPVNDGWSSALLFLLRRYGRLDLSRADLLAAIDDYRAAWLAQFTDPFSAQDLAARRLLGRPQPEGFHTHATDHLIVMIPGPIRVLAERDRDGRARVPDRPGRS